MPNVTEHDREQEWEGGHSGQTRIDFLVRSNTIIVHNILEDFGKLVDAMERRWSLVGSDFVENRRDIALGLFL